MRRLIPVLMLLAACPLTAAEVYRFVDENGQVVYTDRPVPGAELVNIEAPFVGGGPRPRPSLSADEGTESETAEAGGSGAQSAAARSEPTPEERARNCREARERRERYMTSHRLYRENPDGEREYLSSEEIDEVRAQAAADVEQWCN